MIALLLASTLTFKVLGIDCAKCAPPVTKALASVPGVTSVRVDTKAQTATIEGSPDPQKIHEALENAGFEAELPGTSPRVPTSRRNAPPRSSRRMNTTSRSASRTRS